MVDSKDGVFGVYDLVEAVSEDLPQIRKSDVKFLIDSFFEIVKRELADKNTVQFSGFCSLTGKIRKRPPSNLVEFYTPPGYRDYTGMVSCKVSRAFKARLNPP